MERFNESSIPMLSTDFNVLIVYVHTLQLMYRAQIMFNSRLTQIVSPATAASATQSGPTPGSAGSLIQFRYAQLYRYAPTYIRMKFE